MMTIGLGKLAQAPKRDPFAGIEPGGRTPSAKVLQNANRSEGPAGTVARAESHVAKSGLPKKGGRRRQPRTGPHRLTQKRLQYHIDKINRPTTVMSKKARAEAIAHYEKLIMERRTLVAKAQIPKLMEAVAAWAEKLGVEISMKAENGGVTITMNYQGAERTAHIPVEGRTSAQKFGRYVDAINRAMERFFPG